MTFLPIVERELRVAARRRSTYRIRWWTAVVAMALTFLLLFFVSLTAGASNLGKPLFMALTGYALCLCLLAGVLLAADCLSEEKREGTLGLLFLTDLRGYDVVLGKFMAISLNAFYGLLALLPLTALPLLLGGVTGAEFWRTALALVNALFFSLTTGICTSAFMRDAQRAMRSALGLLVLLAAALPALAEAGARLGISPTWWYWTWVSPIYPFGYAREALYLGHPGNFWGSLAISQLMGWLFLALASYALPRQWQEKAISADAGKALIHWLRGRGGSTKCAKERAKWLAVNPVAWLLARGPGSRPLVWWVVALWGAAVVTMNWDSLLFPAKICDFLLKMLVAFQACRFFVEARRTGALELLLCTPLGSRDMIKGQWLAMRRTFLWPVVATMLLSFIPFGVQIASVLPRPGMGQVWLALAGSVGALVTIAWFTVGLVVDMVAVTWVGMWLALSTRKPALAPALTVLVALALSFAFCGLDLILDLGLVLWSVTKLQQDFRWVLARQYQPALNDFAPRPTVSTPGVPPVIRN